MSADNWAICPKCQKVEDDKHAKIVEKAETSYGKIPVDEYLNLLEKSRQPVKLDFTLREDYEIGIQDNEFYVKYKSNCKVCGFSYEYKYDKRIG